MNRVITYTFLILLFFASGCEDDRVPSGLDAKIYWAACDTMQTFSEYDGMIYLVPLSRFGEVADSTWDSLKVCFDSSRSYQGALCNIFAPGDYIAEPDTFVSALSPVIITVEPDLLKKVEIRFLYCK